MMTSLVLGVIYNSYLHRYLIFSLHFQASTCRTNRLHTRQTSLLPKGMKMWSWLKHILLVNRGTLSLNLATLILNRAIQGHRLARQRRWHHQAVTRCRCLVCNLGTNRACNLDSSRACNLDTNRVSSQVTPRATLERALLCSNQDHKLQVTNKFIYSGLFLVVSFWFFLDQ